jgi:DNA invertase Pin-like site-specific DNA recombinase
MSSTNKPTRDPLRLVAYCRVSTNGQAIKGDSPAAQEEACRAWASEHDHEVIAVETDNGFSGTLDAEERPGLTAALVAIADGEADGLIFLSLDRLVEPPINVFTQCMRPRVADAGRS